VTSMRSRPISTNQMCWTSYTEVWALGSSQLALDCTGLDRQLLLTRVSLLFLVRISYSFLESSISLPPTTMVRLVDSLFTRIVALYSTVTPASLLSSLSYDPPES
jgi:hypothetical protein